MTAPPAISRARSASIAPSVIIGQGTWSLHDVRVLSDTSAIPMTKSLAMVSGVSVAQKV
jgi:hypothetical protein